MEPLGPEDRPGPRFVTEDEPAAGSARPGRLGLVLVAIVAFGFVLVLGAGSDRQALVEPIAQSGEAPSLGADPLLEARGPALGVDTGIVLVFDDGLDGLLYVDPDRRIATRRSAGLLRQSRRAQLDVVGDALVVGGVNTEVVSLSTRRATPIPDASYHLLTPDGAIWLVDISPSDEVVTTPTVSKVGLDGEILVPAMKTPIRALPSAVVGDHMVLNSAAGLHLWHPLTGEVSLLTADGGALVVGSFGPQLAWCDHDCTTITVVNTAAASTVDIPLEPELGPINHTTAAWSPSGDEIVVITTEAVVRIAGIATTPQVVVLLEYAIGAGAPAYVAWGPSGEHVYFATDSPRGRLTGLWRSDGSRLGTMTTTLPFSGASGPFVALDAATAGWLVGEAMGTYEECPAPATVQLPDPNVCSFRF